MVLWAVAIFVSVVLLLYFLIVKPLNYWKYQNVPQHHFLTILLEIVFTFVPYGGISEYVQKIYNDFPNSRYIGIYQFFKPNLAIRDPQLIKQILINDFDHFVDRFRLVSGDNEPIWEKNIVSLKGNEWREMRATISPSFTSSKMKVMFTLISDYAKQFSAYFEEEKLESMPVEMKDICTRFTNDVMATTIFGFNCDSLRNPDNDFYRMSRALSNYSGILRNLKALVLITMPKIAKVLNIGYLPKDATTFFTKLVNENMETREKHGIVRQDVIHLLMQTRKDRSVSNGNTEEPIKDQLANDSIAAQAVLFVFAGVDSVATLMSFMAHELALNADIQERVHCEIDETLEKFEGRLTYEALHELKYMDMVIAETLRKWPPFAVTDRMCSKPYTIQPVKKGEVPVHLREGDVVWILNFGLHRDPHIFPDPERFDPDRFNEENKLKIPPYSYNPFGMGPRSCMGSRFVFMETKLMFCYILSKFHLTVTQKTSIPLQLTRNLIQMEVKGGFNLALKRRN